jgi:hypothetical protein
MTGMFISGLLFGTMEGFCDWMYQMITKHEVNWSHVFWTSVLFFGLGAALGAGGIAFAGTEAGEAFMALACLLSPRCLVQGILLASEAGMVQGGIGAAADYLSAHNLQIGFLISSMDYD